LRYENEWKNWEIELVGKMGEMEKWMNENKK